MKNLLSVFILIIAACSAFGQAGPLHEWNATVIVLDESGKPVPMAKVSAIFWRFTSQDKRVSTNVSGFSDANGVFHISHSDTGSPTMLFRAVKVGFYKTAQPYDLGDAYTVGKWNPTITLTLKKVGAPIPMYAKRVDRQPPISGKPIGFDLMVGDWVAPYGAGQTSDLIFFSEYTKRSPLDYDGKLKVSFSRIEDGILEDVGKTEQGGSELRSPHEAPTTGYTNQITRVNISHPPAQVIWDYDPSREYFIRVRTVLDSTGNIKSALYGKIYGDFMHFTYYLNPIPNDRNVEFDCSHNLFPGNDTFPP